nr:ADM_HP1_G0046400.mRNA.1.CDS.1 [Saccharomyces cerevisiae]
MDVLAEVYSFEVIILLREKADKLNPAKFYARKFLSWKIEMGKTGWQAQSVSGGSGANQRSGVYTGYFSYSKLMQAWLYDGTIKQSVLLQVCQIGNWGSSVFSIMANSKAQGL